jgi:hypothetical protein
MGIQQASLRPMWITDAVCHVYPLTCKLHNS